MSNQKKQWKNRVGWMALMFAVGALVGIMAGKNCPQMKPESEPIKAAGETAAQAPVLTQEAGDRPAAADRDDPALEADDATAAHAAAPDLTPAETASPGLTWEGRGSPEELDEASPAPDLSPEQIDRASAKLLIFAYYDALSTDDLAGSRACWHNPSPTDVKRMEEAIRFIDRLEVVPDSMEIKSLDDHKAVIYFTVNGYRGDRATAYKKAARLVKVEDQWKIERTWNP